MVREPRSAGSFLLSPRACRALRQAPATLTQLAAPFGLTQSQLSAFIHGRPFGPRVRERIVALGESLGLAPEQFVVRWRGVK